MLCSGGVATLSLDGVPRLDPGKIGELVIWLYAPAKVQPSLDHSLCSSFNWGQPFEEGEEPRLGIWEARLKASDRRLGPQFVVTFPEEAKDSEAPEAADESLWSLPVEAEAVDSDGDDFSLVDESRVDSDSDAAAGYELVSATAAGPGAESPLSPAASDIQTIATPEMLSPSAEEPAALAAAEELPPAASLEAVDPHGLSLYASVTPPVRPESIVSRVRQPLKPIARKRRPRPSPAQSP